MTRRPPLVLFSLAVALAVLAGCDEARAPARTLDCRDRAFSWSEGRPAINLRHVFCGELRDGRALGLHSVRLVENSDAVARLSGRTDERRGIYSSVVHFADGQRKLSTFFPDKCALADIEASIAHAVTHPLRRHRQWGEIGLSAPTAGAAGYCLDDRGDAFEIRFAVLSDGRVNTAFPN